MKFWMDSEILCIFAGVKNERHNTMALEIRPIPVLTGVDAERFIEEAEAAERNPHTVELALSQEDFERMMAKAKLN